MNPIGAQRTLRIGDSVTAFGLQHTVSALDGFTVRLDNLLGGSTVVTLMALFTAPDFTVAGGEDGPVLPPVGLLDAVAEPVLATAQRWERHVVEVETGRLPGADPAEPPRAGFDPAATTLAERERTKDAELRAAGETASLRSLQRMRGRYRAQGLWGLLDQQALRTRSPFGRANERLLAAMAAAIEAETDESTGTRDRLRRRVKARLDAEHGEGVVELPSKATFNRLAAALSRGRHTFDVATTRRSLANRPNRPFTPASPRKAST
ncbi:hypothetical protein ACIRSS_23800 [Amycolatopsis sp. NPDC101161]|uniref:hypothetical protein n=1 Tax=Amycolatopsis sp. NPDC101161 TaxID=3363940 RepID=UPI003817B29E